MLLVHDHQTQTPHRREHRGSGADNDVDVAAADAMPLVVPLAVGQAACWIATRSPNTARNAPDTAGVRAISGTSITTPRPAPATA